MGKNLDQMESRNSKQFDLTWYKHAYRCEKCLTLSHVEMSSSNHGGKVVCGICGRIIAITASVIFNFFLTAIRKHSKQTNINSVTF